MSCSCPLPPNLPRSVHYSDGSSFCSEPPQSKQRKQPCSVRSLRWQMQTTLHCSRRPTPTPCFPVTPLSKCLPRSLVRPPRPGSVLWFPRVRLLRSGAALPSKLGRNHPNGDDAHFILDVCSCHMCTGRAGDKVTSFFVAGAVWGLRLRFHHFEFSLRSVFFLKV